MAVAREALRERIDDARQRRDRQQINADGRQLEHGENQQHETERDKNQCFTLRNAPRDHRTIRHARLLAVVLEVGEIINRERRRARRRDGDRNPDNRHHARMSARRHERADIGKRQIKNCMMQRDVIDVCLDVDQ